MAKKALEYRIMEKVVDLPGDSNVYYVQKLVSTLGVKRWKTCGEMVRNFDANAWHPYEFNSYKLAQLWIDEQRKKENRDPTTYKFYYPERGERTEF